jgi:hypothetical protein
VAGGGSQTGGNRWGDYSMMTLDPTDDCTFWYTQEYYSFTSFSSWKTRIGSFIFPSCLRTISGNAGTAGVTLSYTDGTSKTVTSQPDGSYSLLVSGGWTGTVTPTHPCFTFSPISFDYNNVKTDLTGYNYAATFNPASGCANIDVTIGANPKGNYALPPGGQVSPSFPGTFAGPVRVVSTNGQNIIASERQIFGSSFSETLGVPNNQLTTQYWFSWYDGLYMAPGSASVPPPPTARMPR